MTTAEITKQVQAPRTEGAVDFETRLALAHVYMDVVLERHHVDATRDVARRAIQEASVLAEEETARPVSRRDGLLREAGDLIRARGWCQMDYENEDGALCLIGAVRAAVVRHGGSTEDMADTLSALRDRIRFAFGDSAHSVSGWNDRSERTMADVLRVLW